MSMDQAKAFIARMKSDKAFHKSIMSIENPEDRFKAIVSAGYETLPEELEKVNLHSVGERSSCGYECIVQGVNKPNPQIKDVRTQVQRKF
ncbi:Nif11-like leader peptide family natural product precursor [Prosthecochloris sp. ZM]|uniref:Nif11-like leader peptide family natural product precursor n=1 Tax=Prosthecochloris sp. ZM TaxID=2283143 RepID=UPI000DF7A84F|nr:Nif11-like leader peptide family RiPP precursor [Prosthecochloris sp. ZM]RDD31142.1 Nif11-like leader peptide family natural product precursor [Prosthecochloris sp. ZM]